MNIKIALLYTGVCYRHEIFQAPILFHLKLNSI